MAMHVLNIMYNCTRVVRACILNNNKYIYHRHHTFHIQVCECVDVCVSAFAMAAAPVAPISLPVRSVCDGVGCMVSVYVHVW